MTQSYAEEILEIIERRKEKEMRQRMKVNICGMPHKVIECPDLFDADGTHYGQIDYGKCEIRINDEISEDNFEETLCHEMLHGILVHIGRSDLSADEAFVQALANAIFQGFEVKEYHLEFGGDYTHDKSSSV